MCLYSLNLNYVIIIIYCYTFRILYLLLSWDRSVNAVIFNREICSVLAALAVSVSHHRHGATLAYIVNYNTVTQ